MPKVKLIFIINSQIVNRNYFEFQCIIGRGGFGKVWQVSMRKTNKKYALKEMSKVKIIDRRSEKSIKTEREFLSKLRHPFIVNMNCAFQDFENLYLVMDLLTGGDLRYHICKLRRFSESKTKFFIACLLLGLEYIHSNNIIHRDIKPENLVFDDKGYLRITDFGVAKIHKEDNSSETSGTPGYMAPEVLLSKNHSFPVDFFAIGIMGYEFMLGQRPYLGKNRKEIKYQVLMRQARIESDEIPEGWGHESVDFINKCLHRKDSRRLGYIGGVQDLKNHEWFNDFDWDSLYNKTLKAPFIPPKGGNFDKKYCEAVENHTEETLERYQQYRERKNFERLFEGYTYINYELTRLTSGNECNTRMTTNSKYNKPMISTNPSANDDKRKNKINNLMNNELVYNTQKKNKFSDNVKKMYNNDNFNIISNKLLNSFENVENSALKQHLKDDSKKNKYKIKTGETNAQNDNDTHLSIIPSSSTSLINNINNNLVSNNIKKINDIIASDKKVMRSSSVGYFNFDNYKQNNKKGRFFEFNSNKLNNNDNNNLGANLNNSNSGDYTNLFNIGNKEQSRSKKHIIDNGNLNSHRAKIYNNIENKSKNNFKLICGSKNTFYLPRLNNQKGVNYNDINHLNYLNYNSNNIKQKNKLNISQFKFKINNPIKKGFNLNSNKLLVMPSYNNYHQIFKRSESSGFMNLGSNINNGNKSNRGIKNNTKKFMGISNSLVNMGYLNNDKKLKRNNSELFL